MTRKGCALSNGRRRMQALLSCLTSSASVLIVGAPEVQAHPIVSAVANPSVLVLENPDKEPGSCYGRPRHPHFSDGPHRITFKPQWFCDPGRAITVTYRRGTPHRCSTRVPSATPETQYYSYGCQPAQSNSDTADFTVPAGGNTLRYVPRLGETGALGGGYYIGCVLYNRSDSSGVAYQNASASIPVS